MPDGLLQTLWDRATSPVVPQSVTQPTVDALTTPRLNQSPTMARLKGFAGGALEGARQLSSPMNMAGMVADDLPAAAAAKYLPGVVGKYLPTLGRAATIAKESMMTPEAAGLASASARDLLNPGSQKAMNQMYEQAKPTFQAMKHVFDGDRTVGGLNSLASRAASAPAQTTLGAVNPYFTPAGGEGVYNSAKAMAAVPVQSAYDRIMSMMGK